MVYSKIIHGSSKRGSTLNTVSTATAALSASCHAQGRWSNFASYAMVDRNHPASHAYPALLCFASFSLFPSRVFPSLLFWICFFGFAFHLWIWWCFGWLRWWSVAVELHGRTPSTVWHSFDITLSISGSALFESSVLFFFSTWFRITTRLDLLTFIFIFSTQKTYSQGSKAYVQDAGRLVMFYLIFDLLEKGRKPGIGKQAPEKLWSRAYSFFPFLFFFSLSLFSWWWTMDKVCWCVERYAYFKVILFCW